MTEHTFELDFTAVKIDATNPMVCVMIDVVWHSLNTDITSIDPLNPTTISITLDLADGAHTLAVTFMNDEYTDSDNDRNVEWLGTRIDGNAMRWRTIDFGGVIHTADIDNEATGSWWKFVITHNAEAKFTFTTPYDYNAV